MGVSTVAYLDPTASIQDVATVIGILSGGKKEKRFLSGVCSESKTSSYYVTVDNISYHIYGNRPDNCRINITLHGDKIIKMNDLSGQSNNASAFWMYCCKDKYPGYNYISFGCREYSQKIIAALVAFFGGVADLNDCDDIYEDFVNDADVIFNSHSSDENYDIFQDALWNLQPIE